MNPMRVKAIALIAALAIAAPMAVMADDKGQKDTWLSTLQTETPQEGFELAVKLSRMGVKTTQPDMEVLLREREKYAQKAEPLIHASEVIAIHFQTIAAANQYWR